MLHACKSQSEEYKGRLNWCRGWHYWGNKQLQTRHNISPPYSIRIRIRIHAHDGHRVQADRPRRPAPPRPAPFPRRRPARTHALRRRQALRMGPRRESCPHTVLHALSHARVRSGERCPCSACRQRSARSKHSPGRPLQPTDISSQQVFPPARHSSSTSPRPPCLSPSPAPLRRPPSLPPSQSSIHGPSQAYPFPRTTPTISLQVSNGIGRIRAC